jgi:tRNA-specific 2-thiouridylase
LYVIGIDREKNVVTAGAKKEVFKRVFTVKNPWWGMIEDIIKPIYAMCKIRYTHRKAKAFIRNTANKRLIVSFEEPQAAPTPGQAAVFYKNDKVLGGGWIDSVLE